MGLVAPGMTKKVLVTIFSREEGTIKETLNIVTKADVFKIPIEANILSEENYEREMQEQQVINPNKTITNSRVREKLTQSIQKGRLSAKPVEKKKVVKQRPAGEDGEDGGEY